MSLGSRLRRLLRPARPAFNREVEAVIAPTYARRDETAGEIERLERAIEDIRRLVADHMDASTEAETVLGRQFAAVRDEVEQLRARPSGEGGA